MSFRDSSQILSTLVVLNWLDVSNLIKWYIIYVNRTNWKCSPFWFMIIVLSRDAYTTSVVYPVAVLSLPVSLKSYVIWFVVVQDCVTIHERNISWLLNFSYQTIRLICKCSYWIGGRYCKIFILLIHSMSVCFQFILFPNMFVLLVSIFTMKYEM